MTRIAFPEWPILIVDDEIHALESAESTLASARINHLIQCQDPREVTNILANTNVSAVVMDLSMPHISGEVLLPQIIASYPGIPVIIMTGENEVDTAVRCMQEGAFDYMVKPVEKSRLISGIRRAVDLYELRRENETLRERLLSDVVAFPEAFAEIITNNTSMHALFRYCEGIVKSTRPILITGETGVGKELLAKAIHTLSNCTGAFVALNAAGLDDNVFSDTLFGHVRGAFTGADSIRKGMIEQASGGTLFLDEIGDLSHASQIKLLRVIQEHEYFPLGSDVAKRTNARLVFATNRDLDALLVSGAFRKDLYHRLKTHHVCIPPLRKRLDDIPILLNYFLDKASESMGKKRPSPPKELFTRLATYPFPGNVRELESMVFEAVAQHETRMLSMTIFEARMNAHSPVDKPLNMESASSFAFFERLPSIRETISMLIDEAMRRAEGNQTIAARLLGISRTALNKRLNHEES